MNSAQNNQAAQALRDALALLRQGEIETAIAALRTLVAAHPGFEPAWSQLTGALMNEGRGDEALALLQAAMARQPRLSFVPMILANVLRVLGRLDEARAILEPVLATGQEYYLFADLHRFSPGDPHIAAMEALRHRAMPPQDLASLLFALAKAYGDVSEPQRGFDLLALANRVMRQLVRYDERTTMAMFAKVKQVFSADTMAAKVGGGHLSEAPVFILGMPRSGTSLVEQILASHPDIAGAGENPLVGQLLAKHCPGFPETLPSDLAAFGADYIGGSARLLQGKARVVDKSLYAVLQAGLLHLALPKARFIWVQRDPVDTCLSCYAQRFVQGAEFANELGELGRYARAYDDLMRHWQSVLPADRFLALRYEEVVGDLEETVRKLLAHCGVGFAAACLAFHRSERPVFTASAAQVRQPLYASSVGRWRPPAAQLRPLLQGLGLSV